MFRQSDKQHRSSWKLSKKMGVEKGRGEKREIEFKHHMLGI
jgi:hypothetical protein